METILVVEHSPNLGLLYDEELREEGYRVVLAQNGRDALTLAVEQKPDCVVLDLHVPDFDGLDLLSRMVEAQPRLPIIIHSTFPGSKDNIMSWAAEDYVVKSSDLRVLKASIRNILERARKSLALASLRMPAMEEMEAMELSHSVADKTRRR